MSQPGGMERWDNEAKRGMDMLEEIEHLQEHTSQLEAALAEQVEKTQKNLMRALKAETEWATFRGLTRDARAIIYGYCPFSNRAMPASVKLFLQRSQDALESPSLEQTDNERSP